jgi:hypothetical protein
MEKEEVNIYNLYDHVTYVHDDINKCLRISWDDRNPIINKLIINEKFFFNNINQISSHYWVEEIKKVSKWHMGETLYLMVLNIVDDKSPMKVYWTKDDDDTRRRYEKISDDGYLCVNWYDDKLQLTNMAKKDCLYNQDWEQLQEHPYILK